jgi:hypothetical protein
MPFPHPPLPSPQSHDAHRAVHVPQWSVLTPTRARTMSTWRRVVTRLHVERRGHLSVPQSRLRVPMAMTLSERALMIRYVILTLFRIRYVIPHRPGPRIECSWHRTPAGHARRGIYSARPIPIGRPHWPAITAPHRRSGAIHCRFGPRP